MPLLKIRVRAVWALLPAEVHLLLALPMAIVAQHVHSLHAIWRPAVVHSPARITTALPHDHFCQTPLHPKLQCCRRMSHSLCGASQPPDHQTQGHRVCNLHVNSTVTVDAHFAGMGPVGSCLHFLAHALHPSDECTRGIESEV